MLVAEEIEGRDGPFRSEEVLGVINALALIFKWITAHFRCCLVSKRRFEQKESEKKKKNLIIESLVSVKKRFPHCSPANQKRKKKKTISNALGRRRTSSMNRVLKPLQGISSSALPVQTPTIVCFHPTIPCPEKKKNKKQKKSKHE
jgi:hypothetical protein